MGPWFSPPSPTAAGGEEQHQGQRRRKQCPRCACALFHLICVFLSGSQLQDEVLCRRDQPGAATFPQHWDGRGERRGVVVGCFLKFYTRIFILFYFLQNRRTVGVGSDLRRSLSLTPLRTLSSEETLQALYHLSGLLLASFLERYIYLMSPERGTVVQVRPKEGRAEGEDRLPRPAGHIAFNALQDPLFSFHPSSSSRLTPY